MTCITTMSLRSKTTAFAAAFVQESSSHPCHHRAIALSTPPLPPSAALVCLVYVFRA